MCQRINDNKSVYIRKDFPYYLIRYNNLRVIKGDEFRKSLGLKNSQSVRNKREILLQS